MLGRIAALLLITLLGVSPVAAQQAAAPADSAKTSTQSDIDLLIGVIENDASRKALIDKLKQAEGVVNDSPADKLIDTLVDGQLPSESLSFGRRIALITQAASEGVADRVSTLWRQLGNLGASFEGLNGGEISVLWQALRELALVIVSTLAVFFVLRRLGKALYQRMGASARDSGFLRTVFLYLASGAIDALIVIAAWAVGYAIALLAFGDIGQIGIRQTLYLNAFLLVEMVKVAVRLVLSPSAGHLRPLPVGDTAARYLSSRLNLIVGVIGYGQLLIVPIINAQVSFTAGAAISSLIAVAVLGFALWLVLRNHRAVADWMMGTPETPPAPAGEAVVMDPESVGPDGSPIVRELQPVAEAPRKPAWLRFLISHWHWLAVIYLLGMFMVVLTQQGNAMFRTFTASGQVLVVALLGLAISGVLGDTIARGVVLPTGVNQRMPLLESRLNRFVPRTLFVLRLAIFLLVVLFALNAISLVDLRGWMASQVGLRLTGVIFSVAMVLLVSFGIWIALTSWVDYRLNPEFGQVPTARERTLLTLLRNAATIALIVITLMFVLSEIGLDIAPLLASAGVLGLAIGFGAQKMVQDIITGIFIQLENAMNVGDVVTVGGTTGTVERLTIRSASLRDVQGVYHIIPFSSVDMVSNYVRDFGYSVCDMGVAYREKIEDVKAAMMDAFSELAADPDHADSILAEMEWFGVQSFGDSAVVVRTRIKCVPGKQWGVGRAYNAVLKRVFDERNIEIPFPHQTIYWGEAKDGSTQRITVDVEGGKTA